MFNKVKQHISNNRGKYGTAVGAGALYGASQIDTPLMNQTKFNAMAHGQNLAHDSANYIDGKLNTNLVNNLNSVGVRNIDPEQINAVSQGYDKFKGTPYTGADAKDAINMAEFNSIPYTQRITSGDDVDDARMDTLKSGANFFIKSAGQAFDHMTESTGVICIPIKQALLEGYQPEVIVENVNKFLANNNTPQDRIGGVVGGLSLYGLGGGGLAAYGNFSNKNRQYQTVDQSLVADDASIGPWDKSMLARGQYLNNMDNRASNLYDNNKAQYFLNPLAAGPISHTIIKGSRDINNGLYKALKNQNSPKIQNKVTVVADPTNAPINAGIDTIKNSSDNYADDVATIRRNNPGHYYLNPLVAGPINEFVAGRLVGTAAHGIRNIVSPTSKSGDTIIYNASRN